MIKLPAEKIGSFYLGAIHDTASDTLSEIPVNYDARDLTTHAVCVGMTGSGKTGLCIGLLEEAALDQVPAIIIDPKGDMTNLLLQFEDQDPASFKKWINADDARRKGMTLDDYAQKTAQTWKEGLASWGQGADRIKALQDAVDYTIFTPGSDAGVPINILGSFAAPDTPFADDLEMNRERIQGIVAALLGMVKSKADPSKSREGILLATIFEHYWQNGENLDMAKIIMAIQNPPVKQLGVFDVDTFFPPKDRFTLAMEFNTLLASPQFQLWLKGENLDIQKLYFTADGQPRHSIFYIAHLSESERMFFVTLLLNALITWMRSQSGTTSLRSLLYFDEIFGYFPPTANPPSKKPLLTLLKQARAFGVGTVLVTQNPVDIDYKGLSNAGTWFIGKLQTERDIIRVKEGLEGALAESGSQQDVDYQKLIAGLSSRKFLLHNVHAGDPIVFNTRWVMSYLRGPLTRPQIKDLMQDKKDKAERKASITLEITNPGQGQSSDTPSSGAMPPNLDPSIQQVFFKPGSDTHRVHYKPAALALAKVRFYDAKLGLDKVEAYSHLCPPPDDFGRINWDKAIPITDWESKVSPEPPSQSFDQVEYAPVPDTLNSSKEFSKVESAYDDYLYQNEKSVLLEHPKLKLAQAPGQSVEDFRMQVNHAARELRDEEIQKIKDSYESKLDRIEEKMRKEEQDLREAEAEVASRRTDQFINVAETIFSVLGGRRKSFGSISSKNRMARKAKDKVEESLEDIEALEVDYKELQQELNEKIEEVTQEWSSVSEGIVEKEITPRRADIKIDNVLLAWVPHF